MIEVDPEYSPGIFLAQHAMNSRVPHFESKNHGLLSAHHLVCNYERKKYIGSGHGFSAKIIEQDLLMLPHKPADGLLMTILFTFLEQYRNNKNATQYAGRVVVQSAVGIFGAIREGLPYTSHITYGSTVNRCELLTEEFLRSLRYAHELILPEEVLETVEGKQWDCQIASMDTDEWRMLAELTEVTEHNYPSW